MNERLAALSIDQGVKERIEILPSSPFCPLLQIGITDSRELLHESHGHQFLNRDVLALGQFAHLPFDVLGQHDLDRRHGTFSSNLRNAAGRMA